MDGETVRIGGHLEDYRSLGGVAFALIRDGSGTSQVTLKKGASDPALFDLFASLPRESVVSVEGTVARSTKANRGVELLPTGVEVLSRSETPLPLGVVDKVPAELDTRFNHRVIDLRKPEVRGVFVLRSALLAGLRRALGDLGFLEVETPKILRQGAEGGATLFALDYFDTRAFLAQSPQLYKQMLMSAGFERVFEIAPAFRAEPSDTVRHLTEFTSLDAEMAYIDGAETVREVLETVVLAALRHATDHLAVRYPELAERLKPPPHPFPRVTFADCEAKLGRPGSGRDLGTEEEKRIGEWMREERGAPYYFITDYPTSVKAQTFYAQRSDSDPSLTGYFDLELDGTEIASGGPREHRLDHLDVNLRSAGLDPGAFASYREAFRFGMPPHGGFGFGVDRLVQKIAGLPNIREARLFPRDRYRLEP
ncbi:MAG: aspartate--tRNA(Asn) ligase [Thermoplasmata archaeon]|nr:aspartate--tRNA(Asn) ligase [Thermoplasmata archaeon]MCI4359855.1 aspartate--tRNA(Asn) ligase [Thermoplasmata archaeon]